MVKFIISSSVTKVWDSDFPFNKVVKNLLENP